ncbi:MAG: MATE family efflux transporter [Lachnospiraceae bacterium]|nr:MATE family efflux transporter [Lachnospiraceae bacterium]
MKSNDMITGRPGKTLFFFALPMIIGNLFQQFYNMVDTIIVGRFVGEEALAAVGASYSFTTVFIMVAIGGGIGASVLTSQYLGAGQHGRMRTSACTALLTFLFLSILLAAFGFFFNPMIMKALNTPENILEDAVLYLQIYFCGLPFLFMYNIISATFNALGKSKIPLYFLIFSSVLNVFLDLWMVLGWHLGVAGVAIATVIAQGLSAVISLVVLLAELKKYPVKPGEKVKLYDVEMLAQGTKIAVPSIIQQSIVSIGMLLVQSVVNGFGSSVLAGYSAGTRVESICIVPMIATGNAVSTFTAQNLGARQPERVRQGLRTSFGIILAFGAGICLVLNLFHDPIISAFIDRESGAEAFATGNAYVLFICWFFAMIGFKAATDGVLRGSGDVGVYMAANLVNLGIRVLVANLCAPIWGVQAVWFAIPMGWTVNFLISYGWYLTGRWSRKRIIA